MAFTHTQSRNFSSGSATDTSSKSYTASSEINIQETVAAGTNTAIAVGIDVSALVSLYLKSSVAATVKVNSTGSPTKTIDLAADEPYCWPMGGNTNPLGASDVTVLYITNVAEALITMYALVDPTP